MRIAYQSIDTLKVPVENLGELWPIHHDSHKLDFRTMIEWESELDDTEGYPTYSQFQKFLEDK